MAVGYIKNKRNVSHFDMTKSLIWKIKMMFQVQQMKPIDIEDIM